MSEVVAVGTAPSGVELPTPGRANYATIARAMCGRYINMLERMFGRPPEGAYLATKKSPTDQTFEVVLYYAPQVQSNEAYYRKVITNLPTQWA